MAPKTVAWQIISHILSQSTICTILRKYSLLKIVIHNKILFNMLLTKKSKIQITHNSMRRGVIMWGRTYARHKKKEV